MSQQLKVGRNQVGVRLVERGRNAAAPILLTAVEIHLDYP